MTFQMTQTIEEISHKIIKDITSRHYSSIGCYNLFTEYKKQYSEADIIKALAFMASEKLIQLQNEDADSVFLKSFVLCDENGEPIKNTMIGCYNDDFGIIFYAANDVYGMKKTVNCWDHLEDIVETKNNKIKPECKTCFQENAQRICLEHNQSLEFCIICKKKAKQNLELAKILGKEETWQKIKNEHHKQYWGI